MSEDAKSSTVTLMWIALLGTVVGSGGVGAYFQFSHQAPIDAQEAQRESYHSQIVGAESRGDYLEANRLSRELEGHEEAWRGELSSHSTSSISANAGHMAHKLAAAEPLLAESLHHRLGRSYALLLAGDLNGALLEIDPAIANAPTDSRLQAMRATVLLRLELWEDALSASELALEIEPESVDALCVSAGALTGLGRLGEADAAAQHALRIRPGYDRALNNLSRLRRNQYRLEEALSLANTVLISKPNSQMALSNKAGALLEMQRFSEGLETAEQTLLINPNSALGHFNTSLACAGLGRFEEALTSAQRARRIRPNDPIIKGAEVRALLALKKFEEALLAVDRLFSMDASQMTTYVYRAFALAGLGRESDANSACVRIQSIWGDSFETSYNIACIKSRLNLGSDALEWLAKAIDLNSAFARKAAQRDPDLTFVREDPNFRDAFQVLVRSE